MSDAPVYCFPARRCCPWLSSTHPLLSSSFFSYNELTANILGWRSAKEIRVSALLRMDVGVVVFEICRRVLLGVFHGFDIV